VETEETGDADGSLRLLKSRRLKSYAPAKLSIRLSTPLEKKVECDV